MVGKKLGGTSREIRKSLEVETLVLIFNYKYIIYARVRSFISLIIVIMILFVLLFDCLFVSLFVYLFVYPFRASSP